MVDVILMPTSHYVRAPSKESPYVGYTGVPYTIEPQASMFFEAGVKMIPIHNTNKKLKLISNVPGLVCIPDEIDIEVCDIEYELKNISRWRKTICPDDELVRLDLSDVHILPSLEITLNHLDYDEYDY